MSKKSDKTFYISIAIFFGLVLIAGAIFYGARQGWFKSSSTTIIDSSKSSLTTNTLNQFLNQQTETDINACSLSLSDYEICLGDEVTGTIRDGNNNLCWLFVNDGTWKFLFNDLTTSNGLLSRTENINVLGTFRFRAICDMNDNIIIDINDCLTNYKDLRVINCDDNGDDNDDEDASQYTCGDTSNCYTGTCPSTYFCEEITSTAVTWCACINDNGEVHPDWKPDGSNYNPTINCEDVVLPSSGDLDLICQTADCLSGNCHHYWWYNQQIHKCGCTETFFCGQYCYDYLYTSGCECPPDSYQDITSRSTYRCIPNGYSTCSGNIPVI